MIFNRMLGRFPIGIWIALIALILIFLAWFMQFYSLIDWEGAIELGIQDNSFDGNDAEQALADVERGVAIADIIWVLPLTVIAFIGLLKKKFIGFVGAIMTFSICVYFPLFYLFRENMNTEIKLAALLLWALPSLLGIIGLWINRAYFESRTET